MKISEKALTKADKEKEDKDLQDIDDIFAP